MDHRVIYLQLQTTKQSSYLVLECVLTFLTADSEAYEISIRGGAKPLCGRYTPNM